MRQAIVRQAFIAMLALAGAVFALSPATALADKQKVVFQVSDNDPAKWNLALNNARNVQADLGKDKVDIEIVAYGPGLQMLRVDSKVAPRLAQALDANIGVYACQNTMRNTKTEKADLYHGIGFVGAGVTHIMKRQSEGWNYIRP
jgi:uncharacterized protein